MLEKYLHKSQFFITILLTVLVITAKVLGLPRSHYFVKLTVIVFAILLFLLGLWSSLGTIYRWKTFKRSYKRVDLERIFGGFGSILYVLIGISAIAVAGFMLFKVLNQW
jgi:hypothetical protein